MEPTARFYFAAFQIGIEKIIKQEVATAFPELRFAFSRPGFITFKGPAERSKKLAAGPKSIFIRLWGEVIAQDQNTESLKSKVPQNALVHAFDREGITNDDQPWPNVRWNQPASSNESVFDLIKVDPEHFFLGTHQHHSGLDPHPGNIPPITLPPEAPSRAYLKIVEAIQRFQPELPAQGTSVLEVGCSPGGATLAMLNLGFRVTGIDPKELDPLIHQNAGFELIRKQAKHVTDQDLKGLNPAWIVMDMSIAPLEAIDELGHLIGILKKQWGKKLNLNRGFLTLKLNDLSFYDQIPLYLRRLEQLGFTQLRPIQLHSNRQEFFVFGNFSAK